MIDDIDFVFVFVFAVGIVVVIVVVAVVVVVVGIRCIALYAYASFRIIRFGNVPVFGGVEPFVVVYRLLAFGLCPAGVGGIAPLQRCAEISLIVGIQPHPNQRPHDM